MVGVGGDEEEVGSWRTGKSPCNTVEREEGLMSGGDEEVGSKRADKSPCSAGEREEGLMSGGEDDAADGLS